jgi:hypothetical protein
MSLLDDISTRGAQVRARVRELLVGPAYPGDLKTRLLAAYVDLALEHHKAIWLLSKSQLNGSAFALVRLPWDALLRALWINKVATDQQIEQASRDELQFPPMHKLRENIKQAYSSDAQPEQAQRFDWFLQFLKEAWPIMSSYTHSGGLQIGRRFTADQVKPNYSEGAIVQALSLVTVALLMMMHTFFVSMGCRKEVEEIEAMLRQYHDDFGERLRATNTDEMKGKARRASHD